MKFPYCEHPVIILNRKVESLIHTCDYIQFGREKIFLDYRTKCEWSIDFPYSMFHNCAHALQDVLDKFMASKDYNFGDLPSVFSNYYIVNTDSGNVYDLFLCVPCRHCQLCNYMKSSHYSQLIRYECESHEYNPYFLLLTYNEEHVPTDECAIRVLRYRDVQLFFKRLRHVFKNILHVNSNFKYFCVGEYGSKYRRPHWHIILFGINPKEFSNCVDDVNPHLLKLAINFCWRGNHRGFNNASFQDYCNKYPQAFGNFVGDPLSRGYSNIQPCITSNGSVKYVTKYICKQHLKAYKSINLGLDFVKQFVDQIKERGNFSYLSRHDGKVHEQKVSSYYVDKLFPSLNKIISVDVRRKFSNLASCLSYLGSNRFVNIDERKKWYRQFHRLVTTFCRTEYEDASFCPYPNFDIKQEERYFKRTLFPPDYLLKDRVYNRLCDLYQELKEWLLKDLSYINDIMDTRSKIHRFKSEYSPSVALFNMKCRSNPVEIDGQ